MNKSEGRVNVQLSKGVIHAPLSEAAYYKLLQLFIESNRINLFHYLVAEYQMIAEGFQLVA